MDRFRIINVKDIDSLGVCWARHSVQQLYSGETYTLQIDSHMRFEQDWDEILIEMLKNLTRWILLIKILSHHLSLSQVKIK